MDEQNQSQNAGAYPPKEGGHHHDHHHTTDPDAPRPPAPDAPVTDVPVDPTADQSVPTGTPAVDDQFKWDIADDVMSQCRERVSTRPGRVGAIPPLVAAFLPQIVSAGVDLAVQALGRPIQSLADGQKDVIRRFVSQSTLQFFDGLIQGLETASRVQ